MSAFNWITVVDLELSELLRECVLLIACLESVTSHKPSQNTPATESGVPDQTNC